MRLNYKIVMALLPIAVVVVIGTVGYRLIGHWTWFDCFYMTIITITTIGYGELPGMTEPARYFTVSIILIGLGTVGYAISTTTQAIIQAELITTFGRRKVLKEVSKLEDHFIICGAGRVGSRVAREMAAQGVDYVIIERDEAVAERMLQQGELVLMADATDEVTLRGARVEYARGMVCTAASDAENVYTTLIARDLNPKIFIVARANEESAEGKLFKAGANKVVSPTRIGSHQMAQALLKPAVSDFIELTTMTGSVELGLEEVAISEGTRLVGQMLKDTAIRSNLDIIVVAIRRGSGEMIFNPTGDATIQMGDRLIAVGKRENLDRLERLAGNKGSRG